ncbi:NUDIX hydrolase [Wenzhouxiangella sp. AB-CW3]|uniref:NUDIX hydrolase n=1 Tax=Wenzhouxiangella sp. AB-CW3 TaxID=2771012 RepID=UPI00168ADAB8|nr:NUDIX hydrolase [Wenzhouxiangella sp. AB-CW3]QOC22141.1 NUDIX hydrolase [Wenzhouxiangella sp. AB-CW3]
MTKNNQLLYSGDYLALARRDGWEYVVRRHPVVVLIAWTPADELLLVEQYRTPVGRRTIELPAGLTGDEPGQSSESLLQAAARELEEETGWRAGRLRRLMRCPTSAGLSDEEVEFIEATDLVRIGSGGGDASEDIVVHAIDRARIDDWLRERYRAGLALDPKIHTALYWAGLSGQPPGEDDKQAEDG